MTMNEILEGTTPSLVIKIPSGIPVSSLTNVELTLTHKGTKEKYYLDSLTTDAEHNTVAYAFTEAQTLALDPTAGLIWQARFQTASGIVGTKPARIEVIALMSGEAMP